MPDLDSFIKELSAINEIEELKKNNIAVAILNGSIILALVIMVKNAIEPAITVFSMAIRNPNATFIVISSNGRNNACSNNCCRNYCIHINLSGNKPLHSLTKDLDELGEIKNNNIAVSIVLGVVIISISLLMQQGIKSILDALIPFPLLSLKDIGL